MLSPSALQDLPKLHSGPRVRITSNSLSAGDSTRSSSLRRGSGIGLVRHGVELHGFREFLHLLLSRFSGDSVALLDFSDELFLSAGNHVQVVVGQLPPLLLDLSRNLFPLAFNLIPVHTRALAFCALHSSESSEPAASRAGLRVAQCIART